MRALIPILVGTLGFAALYLASTWAVRRLYPRAWARGRVRRAVQAVPAVWAGGLVFASVARGLDAPTAAHVGFATAAGVVVLLVSVLAPLYAALLIRAALRVQPTPAPAPATEGTTRRELLLRSTAVLPATGVAAAMAGGAQGFAGAHLSRLEMTFPDLPPELDGFSILHYTDMHLGTFVDLYEVDQLVELGRRAGADLVVLTGDMADDVDRLLPALRRFESLDPAHGVLASIGNHEYFRGVKKSLSAYAKTQVGMLIEDGSTLEIGGARLYVGGADDPRILRGDKMAFMERTVNEALDGAPSDAFRVLLSHRPEGFVPAAQAGFHLTLSGHTHGAQLGFDGRSLLEGFLPDRYLWGAYQAGDKRLYTSSGAGHWFPFRLGCPREVPLIVLRRGPAGQPAKKTRLA